MAKALITYCCLPTPLTITSGGARSSSSRSTSQHSPSIWPTVPSLQRGLSTSPGSDNVVRMWVQLKRSCVSCVLQRGHSGDGCVLASTLCKYDLRKGDCLF